MSTTRRNTTFTNVYKDDLKNRLDNGLISKTKYDELANDGFDHVRARVGSLGGSLRSLQWDDKQS